MIRDQRDRLVDLLEPFAHAADRADEKAAEAKRLGMGRMSDEASPGLGIKFGHLRRAREAYRFLSSRAFPEAADGTPTLPMEAEIWSAGADQETAKFVARILGERGYRLVGRDETEVALSRQEASGEVREARKLAERLAYREPLHRADGELIPGGCIADIEAVDEAVKLLRALSAQPLADAGDVERGRQQPIPYSWSAPGKVVPCLSFDKGALHVYQQGAGKQDGDGYFTFKDDDLDWEQDDESGIDYRIAKVENSDLLFLRDHLNRLFPSSTAPDELRAEGDVIERAARAICEEAGEDPDEDAPRSMICGPDNQTLPMWRYYESLARAALEASALARPDRMAEMEGLRELSEKATAGEWVAFDEGAGKKSTLAIMKGYRPREGRWPEIVAWTGFDAADVSLPKRRANLHFIVACVNHLRAALSGSEGGR